MKSDEILAELLGGGGECFRILLPYDDDDDDYPCENPKIKCSRCILDWARKKAEESNKPKSDRSWADKYYDEENEEE